MRRRTYQAKNSRKKISHSSSNDPLRSYITQIEQYVFLFKNTPHKIKFKYDILCNIIQKLEFSINALNCDIPIIAQTEHRLNLVKKVEEIKTAAKRRRGVIDAVLGRPIYTIEEELNINSLLKKAEIIRPEKPRTFTLPSESNYIPSLDLALMLRDLEDYKNFLLSNLPDALAEMRAEEDLKQLERDRYQHARVQRKTDEQAREERKADKARAKEAKKLEKEKIVKEQAERNAALAAEAAGKTRRRAQTIRQQLHKRIGEADICPYCGLVYDVKAAHADHIYPVSHGGLSTASNMIIVCRDCNRQKSNLTLREFIEKYTHICREEVELRLKWHKKKF